MAIAEENEFYSKLCVARIFKGAVEKKREKEINLWDITEYKDKVYTKSFLDYAKTKINDVDIFDKVDVLNNKENTLYPQKVGSYIESLFNIVNCVRNTKYKDLFFRIDLKLLNPDVVIQPILPWNGIVEKFLDHEKEYEGFMEECLKDPTIRYRLKRVYGGVDAELNCVSSNEMYLHAELNLLTSVMNHEEKRIFIAVSKKCCYLCELYIRYVQEIKGYNVAVSGSHKSLKKLCSRWKLPDTFKKEFMSYAQLELDRIIEYEIKLCTEPDSESECIEAYLNSPFYHNF
ncbi:uncharacterized protein OCT59_011531 [Rhizophagus irregularis]|uniref:uncharacterized protein n=1 Tax=Rhizophagus irregularis TaxID=588596 RepID=UPI00332150CC|nr:hypothetical protein OCT59_011531 [Rhizophagus irregularis]